MFGKKKQPDPNKVGAKTMLLWCGNGASAAVQAVLLGYLTIYCTNALMMDAILVGTVVGASKLLDAFTDLVAGYIVDKTNTKLGRGRPYDLCVIGLWFTTWLLFSVPTEFTTVVKCVWIFICYALCQSIFRTFMNAAGTSYMVRAFNNEQKYVKISSYGGLITTGVIMVFNVVMPMMYASIISDPAGWSSLVMFIAIPMAIIGALRFFFIPEKYVVEDSKNEHTTLKDIVRLLKSNKYVYPVMGLQFLINFAGSLGVSGYYFLYIVKNVEISGVMSIFTIFALLTMFFYPMILKKISTRKLIQYAMLFSIVSAVLAFVAKENLILLAIAAIFLGVSQLPPSYMGGLLIIDCADYNEWKGIPRMEGTLGSIVGFATKVGTAAATVAVGWLLSLSGFDGALETQPDSAIMMIRVLYAIAPTVLYLLGGFVLGFFTIDEKKEQINADLAERRKHLTEA